MENREDPTVSAVVSLSAAPDMAAVGRTKTAFSVLGFEVHAPLGTMFSIGGKRSLFEKIFAITLVIDEESLASAVTTGDGGAELPLEPLDGEIRAQVKSIAFMPPPAFPMDFAAPK